MIVNPKIMKILEEETKLTLLPPGEMLAEFSQEFTTLASSEMISLMVKSLVPKQYTDQGKKLGYSFAACIALGIRVGRKLNPDDAALIKPEAKP